mgnify:CR=1 FL=1
MDIVLSVLPELVTLVIAVGIVFARTTDNAIDDKVFKLAQDNKPGIVSAIRGVAGTNERDKRKVQDPDAQSDD